MAYFQRVGKIRITVDGYRCERCGHQWIPRSPKEEPRMCPKCKSVRFDQPRKPPKGKAAHTRKRVKR
jgi:predicted Zn-ribbon and HTH transcriptional regulator